jgi:hypothetical protein
VQKEKCPECGEMEIIGRPVCETKLMEASAFLDNFIQESIGVKNGLIIFTTLFASFSLMILMILMIEAFKNEVSALIIFICTIVFVISCGYKIENWEASARKKAERSFFFEHPEYTEILKKAEEKK